MSRRDVGNAARRVRRGYLTSDERDELAFEGAVQALGDPAGRVW